MWQNIKSTITYLMIRLKAYFDKSKFSEWTPPKVGKVENNFPKQLERSIYLVSYSQVPEGWLESPRITTYCITGGFLNGY